MSVCTHEIDDLPHHAELDNCHKHTWLYINLYWCLTNLCVANHEFQVASHVILWPITWYCDQTWLRPSSSSLAYQLLRWVKAGGTFWCKVEVCVCQAGSIVQALCQRWLMWCVRSVTTAAGCYLISAIYWSHIHTSTHHHGIHHLHFHNRGKISIFSVSVMIFRYLLFLFCLILP